MVGIDWQEYKEFKLYSVRDDNFEILLDFLKSYYNLTNPYDIMESLMEDETAILMLQKRFIANAEDLERFMRRF
jgi:hypothetical protein